MNTGKFQEDSTDGGVLFDLVASRSAGVAGAGVGYLTSASRSVTPQAVHYAHPVFFTAIR